MRIFFIWEILIEPFNLCFSVMYPVESLLRLRATKSFFKAFSFAVFEVFVSNLLSYDLKLK